MIAGHDDKPPLYKVIVPELQSTREPTDAERRLIESYIAEYTREIGMPPLADHPVEGVGEVWFMRPPSPFAV